jgi:hypothetical protein
MPDDLYAASLVITPAEVADLLPLPFGDVIKKAQRGELPGLQCGSDDADWRFARPMIEQHRTN